MLKKVKKYRKKLKSFFYPLESNGYIPDLEITSQEKFMMEEPSVALSFIGNRDEDIYRRNTQKLEIAKLNQEKDAINKNLKAQHRLMIATLIAAVVALLSGMTAILISLHSKPPSVIVRPNITVQTKE